ncbi:MAG: amino acid racemase, partial [Gammaproteobacteria bacterium]|nr:amino acid racemase [Gammaproteobacteria bacterium]
ACARILASAARRLQAAEADCVMICTNTMHKVADEVESATRLPLLHIADATAEQILAKGFKKVGLLGTGFTMSQDFYKGRLQDKFGIEVLTPTAEDQQIVHEVIYGQLCLGNIVDDSRREYLRIMDALAAQGAEAVILGCTEITLLVDGSHTEIPLLDTTAIHAQAAVDFALDRAHEKH